MFGLEIDGSSIAVDADELPSVQEVIALGNNAGNHSRAEDKAGTNKNSVDN